MDAKKRTLVKMAFEQAKNELPRGTKTSVASYLSSLFEEKHGFSKNEKTFFRYFTELMEKNKDYTIDDITLDQLSSYIGYKNYKDFCNHTPNKPFYEGSGSVKVSISDEKGTSSFASEAFKIVINNTISIPEFLTKNQNSFGIIGILLLGGFIWNKMNHSPVNNKNELHHQEYIPQVSMDNNVQEMGIPQTIAYIPLEKKSTPLIIETKRKECMYWKNDHYEPAFCDEKISGKQLIAANEDILQLFRKINAPDTLTIENAIGKVWYDKSDNQIDFFTHYGIHPENGKTLKPVSVHIIQKYAMNP